jgi:hypothetical protein
MDIPSANTRDLCEANFPDVLNLDGEALHYLQAGWRASDEGDKDGKPRMDTTKPWQVLAWAATRYGSLYIYLGGLEINKGKPSIEWLISRRAGDSSGLGKRTRGSQSR